VCFSVLFQTQFYLENEKQEAQKHDLNFQFAYHHLNSKLLIFLPRKQAPNLTMLFHSISSQISIQLFLMFYVYRLVSENFCDIFNKDALSRDVLVM
jgi:hypothetical protein